MENNYPALRGVVVEGRKIARELGYPTMNLDVPINFSLDYGIYAGFMEYNNIKYPSVISMGVTPNFETTKPVLEVHVFNFHQDLYGQSIKIIPIHYLRQEMKFDNIELLIGQIEQDCISSKAYLYDLING